MLAAFLATHRDELLARARLRVAQRAPEPIEVELSHGLPAFFDQLQAALLRAASQRHSDHSELTRTAAHHGQELFQRGSTIAQVVHDYGGLCQAITGLSMEMGTAITAGEFQTLNLCLDDAIAGAVTEFGHQRERALGVENTERLGALAHELRNYLNTATLAFASIRTGIVAVGGSTGAVLERSLLGIQSLLDRSLADVRLEAGLNAPERLCVREVLEEVEIGASLYADAHGLTLHVQALPEDVFVLADRQLLAAAITNLLQNAYKFTRPGTTVSLVPSHTATRVSIDIADECGGLPPGRRESLLRPFVQRGSDRSGLGLGLSICLKAMRAMSGELRVRDLPGHGCVFTIDLPRHSEAENPKDGSLGRVP